MKIVFTVLALFVAISQAFAQSEASRSIVQNIVEESDSTISIELSPSLINDFMPETKDTPEEAEESKPRLKNETPWSGKNVKKSPVRTNGYRIQIFCDGRNQGTLQARARTRAKSILAKFPKYNRQVYSFSKAPNYYTRIGNFATRAEANRALAELRRAFPQYAGEMRVVSSEVILNR